jgi:thioredoxin domain-containing protein 5
MSRLAVICLAICLVLHLESFICLAAGESTKIDINNYKEMIFKDDAAWIVEVSSKHCGSCKEFAPDWQALTEKMKTLKIGHVSMDEKEGQEFADLIGAGGEGRSIRAPG